MKEMKAMVSVLIPCYNHEKFVADCLESILNQTYPRFEVIICDDCSKDQSVSVIKKQSARFEAKGIRLLLLENEENRGITKNINRMLKEAKGEYVKIIASDDMLAENYMSEMVASLEQNASLKFLFSNGYKVKEAAAYPVEQKYFLEPLMNEMPDCTENVLERIYSHNFVPAPTLLFRRSVLDEVGGYDESIAIEDLEMLLRVLQRYPQGMGACEKKLVYYRINDNSITSMVSNAGAKKRIRFMYENSVAIARKYRNQVTGKVYRRRMWELHKEYLLKRLIVFVKGLKE